MSTLLYRKRIKSNGLFTRYYLLEINHQFIILPEIQNTLLSRPHTNGSPIKLFPDMKHVSCTLFFASLFTLTLAQPAKHVVLITIDGMNTAFYKDPSWPAPTLQQLKADGSFAEEMQPVFPSVTYPDHTSMITGATPARHGIYANTPFEPLGITGKWNWEYEKIKVPTLFDAVHKAGGTSAAVSWPVSVGAPVDYNIVDIWSVEKGSSNKSWISRYSTPAGIYEEVQQNATGTIPDDEVNGETIRTDQNAARMACYLIEKYKPTLTCLHLFITDGKQHVYGRNNTEVRKALAGADACIQQVMDALEKVGLKDSTAIIVAGDHGFSDIHTVFRPNVLLTQNDLGTGAHWRAKFYGASAAAFLHVQDAKDTVVVSQVRKLLNALPNSEQRLFRILEKDDLVRIGADPGAVFAITGQPGVAISSAEKGQLIGPAKGGAHGFYPDFPSIQTGMIAWGTGIQKGIVIPKMQMMDIAPLVAALLGLDFPVPDGILWPGLIQPKK